MLVDYLKKMDNESQLDYIIRLVEGKSNGTYDIDYTELFRLGFGVEFSSDHCRKMYYALKMLLPYLDQNKIKDISGEEILKELESKKIEIQKEKYKVQTLRLDLNRIIRESSRTELLYEEFINTLKEVQDVELPKFQPLKIQDTDREYVLSFADSHFGKEFRSITNEYSIDVVYERFNKLLSEMIELIEEKNIKHLHVLALGDLIEGMSLRIGMLPKLKVGMVQQTIMFMRFIVQWLRELSKYVTITYYSANASNHTQTRPFGTKANEFPEEDNEKIIHTYIHDMLENNPRITVVKSEDKHTMFQIFDYNIIAWHGHNLKNSNDFLDKASLKYKKFFDYAFLAHVHHGNIKTVGEGKSNNCEIIGIPSIMGSDDYADDLFVGAKAGAILVEFTRRQGKRNTTDIILN